MQGIEATRHAGEAGESCQSVRHDSSFVEALSLCKYDDICTPYALLLQTFCVLH